LFFDGWTIEQAQASPFFNAPTPDEDRIRHLIGELADGSA
jgi:hypothetical protein